MEEIIYVITVNEYEDSDAMAIHATRDEETHLRIYAMLARIKSPTIEIKSHKIRIT